MAGGVRQMNGQGGLADASDTGDRDGGRPVGGGREPVVQLPYEVLAAGEVRHRRGQLRGAHDRGVGHGASRAVGGGGPGERGAGSCGDVRPELADDIGAAAALQPQFEPGPAEGGVRTLAEGQARLFAVPAPVRYGTGGTFLPPQALVAGHGAPRTCFLAVRPVCRACGSYVSKECDVSGASVEHPRRRPRS
ncbi:hypothetical protein SVIO_064500 [Streptomyces violaceusniger]|uniref:Uncharacterized protein n=1 Tax=Streptomyces violaceusniger TaxID=68280 RepID=A0A4D4LB80_STRVO|nr:hypothetical protein SVIO_064500 [Streptomyces violaceusniger]